MDDEAKAWSKYDNMSMQHHKSHLMIMLQMYFNETHIHGLYDDRIIHHA